MNALNPIYGFIGRSSNAAAMALVPSYTGLSQVIQAAIALGNDDPTAAHIAGYSEALARKFAAMPTDEQWAWGFSADTMYALSENGIAFIPVWGMLFNKCGWACSYFTGYDYVRDAYAAALADFNVQKIVFDVDSFGGEVQGCMELADWMFAQRDIKPTLAIANANACSAGYAILSSAAKTTAIESSYVGSVGVVLMHVDYSAYLEKSGIKVTLLYEGAHKVDGNAYEPLPEATRKEWQADLAKARERFASVVARNRGMNVDAVLATEARVYSGEAAVGVGFVDAVMSPLEALAAFTTELTGSTTQENEDMTTSQKPGAQATPDSTTSNSAPTAASGPSAADERARIKAITASDEAKGRETLAEHLAFETSMSADEAKAILAAAPKAVAEQASTGNPFDAAMTATGNPNVGADANPQSTEASEPKSSPVAALLRDYGAASGRDFSK